MYWFLRRPATCDHTLMHISIYIHDIKMGLDSQIFVKVTVELVKKRPKLLEPNDKS